MMMRLVLLLVGPALCYDNGNYAKKPPLGWQSWCAVGECGTDHCFDAQIRATADAMASNGMRDLGYDWLVLDDCWHPTRDETSGALVPAKDFFPDGLVPVIDYVHAKGFKFGLYTSVGNVTCHGGWSPGSFGHYDEDAALFASWGVDWVKMDWCGGERSAEGHRNFSRALNATGREMVLELCRGDYIDEKSWGYAPDVAQVWRAARDHHDDFNNTLLQIEHLARHSDWSGPFGWAYGDMMMTGGEGCKEYDPDVPRHCPKQSDAEYRSEFAAYAVLASPMMIGTDVRNMTPIMEELILNADAVRINQDASPPGAPIATKEASSAASTAAYARRLTDGRVAVALLNVAEEPRAVALDLDALCGAPESEASLRDVFKKEDLGDHTSTFTSRPLEAHDALFALVACRP